MWQQGISETVKALEKLNSLLQEEEKHEKGMWSAPSSKDHQKLGTSLLQPEEIDFGQIWVTLGA